MGRACRCSKHGAPGVGSSMGGHRARQWGGRPGRCQPSRPPPGLLLPHPAQSTSATFSRQLAPAELSPCQSKQRRPAAAPALSIARKRLSPRLLLHTRACCSQCRINTLWGAWRRPSTNQMMVQRRVTAAGVRHLAAAQAPSLKQNARRLGGAAARWCRRRRRQLARAASCCCCCCSELGGLASGLASIHGQLACRGRAGAITAGSGAAGSAANRKQRRSCPSASSSAVASALRGQTAAGHSTRAGAAATCRCQRW